MQSDFKRPACEHGAGHLANSFKGLIPILNKTVYMFYWGHILWPSGVAAKNVVNTVLGAAAPAASYAAKKVF